MGDIAIGILVVLLVAAAMLFMVMRSMRLTKVIEVEPEPQPFVMQGIPNESREKIERHIRRFTLAMEQCEKGPKRRAELQRNLIYWQMRLEAENKKAAN